MLDLLKIELKKIIPYTAFWVIFGLVFLLIPAVFFALGKMIGPAAGDMYSFPGVWNNITYLASWFNLLIGMMMVILVCNEFSFKTFRQHVIDGQSKSDFIIAKIQLMVFLALASSIYVFIVGALFGLANTTGDSSLVDGIKYVGVYFIQALGYMSVALIIATLIRSTALSIIIFMLSILIESIIQVIIQIFSKSGFENYFPMEIIANLTPNPILESLAANQQMMQAQMQQPGMPPPPPMPEPISLSTTVIVACVYILVFWGITYFILTKKDIK